MKTQTTSLDKTLDDQEALLERLQDSFDAMTEVQNLTQNIGSFVVRSRIQSARSSYSSSSSEPLKKQSRKRKRDGDEDQVSGNPNNTENSRKATRSDRADASVKRMFILYKQIQKTQALFQSELEKFIEETEEQCDQGEEDSLPVSAE
mmetsp:Transcript_111/g.156  ORF Transcript_111/g.156 Transcript_111/m.156 type:complete len:148 (+) Transcript_111:133-576(+)|eukprot:CAMPEP_0202445342 /NCGR_PEP_ID=MMETSP1360-20130828/4183_1 /ASSEMBLY_ACC=CAM_ASM_000848 /TAXON_ID=515479 /ORGANISM="Licmophora paradoxa, Strain CCMP2313" /LENGTH=147 /DNA_ID=CAMNT_0049061567 /DNA_START=22 /DNA_END=465 /DNA_ORIENTATION=+